MSARRKPFYYFWTPNYWPHWLALGIARLLWLLPLSVQRRLFRSLGRLGYRIDKKHRTFARRNIELCFPELSADECDTLVLAHYEALALGLMELGLAGWAPEKKFADLLRIEGAENINAALEQGKAVILLTGHFTTIELTGHGLREVCPKIDVVYQDHKNQFVVELLRSARARGANELIENDDVRGMVRSLRSGHALWFAPDQTARSKQCALIPFFGQPAMTNCAASKLARIGNAVAIPVTVDPGFPEDVVHEKAIDIKLVKQGFGDVVVATRCRP